MIDIQILIDRMLESENLTDNLDDADAEWLLDWGTDRLREFGNAPSTEVAEERAGALMKFMRGLNHLAGSPPNADPADLPGLLEDYAAAFGSSRKGSQSDFTQAAAKLSKLSPRGALEYLIDWALPV